MLFFRRKQVKHVLEIVQFNLSQFKQIYREELNNLAISHGLSIYDLSLEDKVIIFVASINDNPVGFLTVKEKTPNILEDTGIIERDLTKLIISGKVPVYTISQLVIKKENRGSGIGFKLLKKALHKLRGVVLSYVVVSPCKNWATYSLFQKVGFKTIGFYNLKVRVGVKDFESALFYKYNM